MKLTSGAVKALIRGARCGNMDINAVMEDGTEKEAGQICCEDDAIIRKAMGLDEYNPILEVVRSEWLGKWLCPTPVMKFYCTNMQGEDEICVMVAQRCKFRFAKNLHRKGGPIQTGRLNVGRRFQLVDYTTDVAKKGKFHSKEEPVVRMERIRCEPVSMMQKKMKEFLKTNTEGSKSG